jgi:hypothetical protein
MGEHTQSLSVFRDALIPAVYIGDNLSAGHRPTAEYAGWDMELLSDLKTLYQLTAKPVRGTDQAARLESFYAGQAAGYDGFRRRLLPGRRALWEALPVPPGGTWIDMGGGTGQNLEHLGPRLRDLQRLYVVDLCPSLLAVARQRIAHHGWSNVELIEGDVTSFQPAEHSVDVVTREPTWRDARSVRGGSVGSLSPVPGFWDWPGARRRSRLRRSRM